MAVTTFLDLCQQLVEDAGISGTFTSVAGQTGEFKRVVDWVVRATTEIEGVWFDWDFLHNFHTFNTVIGVSDYPAPSNHNLWDDKTAKIPAEEFQLLFEMWTRRKRDFASPVAGDPFEFTVLPDKAIRLFDTPVRIQTIAIEYWQVPTVLVNNADVPSMPKQFRDIIVAKALQFYANYESADEVKTQAIEIFTVRMRQLESHSAPSRQARDSINTGAEIQVEAERSNYEYF